MEAIVTDRNKHLPEIAAALAEAGDSENFKRLLISCAYGLARRCRPYYLDAAYRM